MEEEVKESDKGEKKSTQRKSSYSRWHMNRSSSPCIINQEMV
jgi:hypothetical protein